MEFSCSNHKSIRDEVLFSAVAGKDTTYQDKIEDIAGVPVLKAAVIYGANGSGKSNFIDAISFVKRLVMNSINYQPGQGIRQTPHKLDGFEKESSYKLQFVTNGTRYVFAFSLQNMIVAEEYLYYFPNGRQTKIFERSGDSFTAGRQFRGKFSSCKDVLKPNRLLLSCAANFSAVEEIAMAYHFFADELVVYSSDMEYDWMIYSLYEINTNPQIKEAVLTFLAELGTGIKDIRVHFDDPALETSEFPPFLSDEFKSILLQEKMNTFTISAKVIYDNFETDLIQEESIGIKKLFALLCPLIDIMLHGKVLICDELESGLHESLVFELVKLFVNVTSQKFAQMIFTTHETGLLNLDLFRRDQIWFTELKLPDRSTELFSLAEIKSIRKEENFGKGYIAGKYGAIPMLNLDFANIVSGM